jgi:hypothetical protein
MFIFFVCQVSHFSISWLCERVGRILKRFVTVKLFSFVSSMAYVTSEMGRLPTLSVLYVIPNSRFYSVWLALDHRHLAGKNNDRQTCEVCEC